MFDDFWTDFHRSADELDQDDAPTLKFTPAWFYMLMLTLPTVIRPYGTLATLWGGGQPTRVIGPGRC